VGGGAPIAIFTENEPRMSSLVEVNPFPLGDPVQDGRGGESGEPRREINFLSLAWRSRWLIVLTMVIGGVAGWALLERATPRYTSASQIYVERSLPQILDEQIQASYSANYLATQAALIQSTSVLAAAAEDPDVAALPTFRELDSPVGFLKKELQVSVGANNDLISIWIEIPIAEDAAQIVNSVVDAYIKKYAEQRETSAAEVLSILREEKASRDRELAAQREELDEFRRQHPELAVQLADDNVVTIRFAALSQQLNETEIELLQAKALYTSVKKLYDTPSQRAYLLEMAGAEQQAMRDLELERQVKQLEQALVSERAQWGEGHPRVKLLKDSLDEMKEELVAKQAAIIESYVESIRQQYDLLDHKRSELQAAYDRQFEAATRVSALGVQLAALQDALTRTEGMCDILEERIKEVSLTDNLGAMQVSILETAGVSTLPTYPDRTRFLAIGILSGGLCGFGLAWLRDLLDHRLRSVDEVADVLQLPVLGMVPHLGPTRHAFHVGRLVAHAPRSQVAEAMRTLRTALHFGLAGQDAKTIAVTSPLPGDGKSTIASNLAIAMAQADQKVLIIDADMRKPTQHQIFEVEPVKGLASVLADRRPAADAIIPSGVDSLDLLPCGPLPSNPVELLNNGFFAELLEELKGRYDKIIIDSPPVMPVADARVIAAVSDSTLLVLRAESSTRRVSLGARNELWRVRATRLGVVVNGVPTRKQSSYGYGHSYGYGDSQYGYGHSDDDNKLPSPRRKKSRALPAPQPTPAAAAGDEI
jgi:succinoglycan biosynthesis transport protein ExoP